VEKIHGKKYFIHKAPSPHPLPLGERERVRGVKGEIAMPIVQISMIQGRTAEKKEELIKKVTDAIVDALRIPKDRVRIILNEVSKENLGYGGVPLSKIDQ
jgi:4-oxalocrotonate tautomerase